MVIKVGINGFGRIGRIITRACLQNSDLQVAAINDPAISTEYICYLLKFDSTHGKLKSNISHFDNLITIDDLQIKVFHENLPTNIPWQTVGVQYVVESSGMFASLDKASGHLEKNGVKRVIVTAPSTDIPMVILGVNENILSPEQKVISCASSTLYCLAPIIKILEDNFGVSECFLTSIHAMTPSLKPLDGLCLRGKHWRDHRSIHQNIIPAATGACKALGKIIPQVKDKLSGLAFRVPIVDVSVLDLSLRLSTNTNLQDIVKCVEKSSLTTMANIIKLTNEDTVSSDFMGERYSCIFDVDCSIQLKQNFFKIICWYENEYSYACRVIDSIFFSEKQQCSMEFPSKLRYIVPKTVSKRDEILQTEIQNVNVSVECNCDAGITDSVGCSDIFYLANSMSPKITSRPIMKTKTLQAGSCCNDKHMKKNMFSLCRENNNTFPKPMVKQNCGSFFQSCMAFSSTKPAQKKSFNAKERLESVRREFSKMINITEDFLKKSSSSQSHSKLGVKDNDNNLGITPKIDDFKKSKVEIKPIGDPSDKLIKKIKESDKNVKKNESKKKLAIHPRDICDPIVNQLIMPVIKFEPIKPKVSKETPVSTKACEVKELVTDAVDTLVENFKESEPGEIKTNNDAETRVEDIESKPSITDVDLPHTVDCQNINNNIASTDVLGKYKRSAVKNVQIIDQELKKRSIFLVDSLFTTDIETSLSIMQPQEKKDIPKVQGTKELLRKHNLNRSKQPFSDGIVLSEDTSLEPKEKIDVYDKLDSESETDSNNSFEVHAKKSQVIHITDLTNSLEDLSRLDKLCRIIEISDELSDKLFSNLDNEGTIMKNKKWSFKDLCDKIQLDEFCGKIFGP